MKTTQSLLLHFSLTLTPPPCSHHLCAHTTPCSLYSHTISLLTLLTPPPCSQPPPCSLYSHTTSCSHHPCSLSSHTILAHTIPCSLSHTTSLLTLLIYHLLAHTTLAPFTLTPPPCSHHLLAHTTSAATRCGGGRFPHQAVLCDPSWVSYDLT